VDQEWIRIHASCLQRKLFVREEFTSVAAMCLAFCLTSSAGYILNDYMDMEQDKAHPLKRSRPLASGQISPGSALILTIVLLAAAGLLASIIKSPVHGYAYLAGYIVLQVFYSITLKHLVILDVLTISTGFLLRVLGGAAAMGSPVSAGLILCTFSVRFSCSRKTSSRSGDAQRRCQLSPAGARKL